jgi:hypothetical protein
MPTLGHVVNVTGALAVTDHVHVSHRIRIAAPVERCFRFFTPMGETLWVDGWAPRYIRPADGRAEAGMVFTTGSGDEFTVWMLIEFDPAAFRSRYARVTPALRTGPVEISCEALAPEATAVDVSYTLTALSEPGRQSLAAYAPDRFAAMIDGWKTSIDARLPELMTAALV